jgi:uncharacterized repeat protein (TIGR03837 family)
LKPTWVIFCRVVDNLGDAGVCWRLARQLVEEHAIAVDLIIDQPEILPRFGTSPDAAKFIRLIDWKDADSHPLGDVTIAAFACRLPLGYQQRLATRQSMTTEPKGRDFFNLEYLSAQTWSQQTHLRKSTHADGTIETFFMPGFLDKTGGLIREARFTRANHLTHKAEREKNRLASRHQWGFGNAFAVSLFCYVDAPVSFLLDTLAAIGLANNQDVVLVVNTELAANLRLTEHCAANRSPLIQLFEFQTQDAYDDLLLACDLNFVRGEDSWLRAIWAGQPFVWQAYRQDQKTVDEKTNAFAQHWCQFSGITPNHPAMQVFAQWNQSKGLATAAWLAATSGPGWQLWQQASRQYCDRLCQTPDLASQLVAASTTI